jgi:hypothetical protein
MIDTITYPRNIQCGADRVTRFLIISLWSQLDQKRWYTRQQRELPQIIVQLLLTSLLQTFTVQTIGLHLLLLIMRSIFAFLVFRQLKCSLYVNST